MHIDYLKTINAAIERARAYLIVNYFSDTDSRGRSRQWGDQMWLHERGKGDKCIYDPWMSVFSECLWVMCGLDVWRQ